jgi:plasmid stability protein
MSKMIQLRNVPDPVHRRLKAKAAMEGVSLSDLLIREVRKIAERPTLEEMRKRLEARPIRTFKRSPTELLREERDRR